MGENTHPTGAAKVVRTSPLAVHGTHSATTTLVVTREEVRP